MPSLTLSREARYGLLRSLKVEIDTEKTVSLNYAEEKTIELPTATHALVARMSWTKSKSLSITLSENQRKHVVIGCLPLLEACVKAYVPPFEIFTLKERSF